VKYNLLLIFLLSSLITFPLVPAPVYAHPGRTDSSGDHTCRTNCANWGLGDGEYHSHGGGGSSGGSTGNTFTAPEVESSLLESNQRFMEYRNAILSATPSTKIPSRTPTRLPIKMPTLTVTLTPSPTTSQMKKARPIQATN
jgi:hypothetical protein